MNKLKQLSMFLIVVGTLSFVSLVIIDHFIPTITTQTLNAGPHNVYTIHLTDVITYANGRKVASVINKAKAGDVVLMEVDSPGGLCSAGDRIIEAMSKTPAKVVVIAHDLDASMAAIITLAAKHVIIDPNTLVLIHAPFIDLGFGVHYHPHDSYWRTSQKWADDILTNQEIHYIYYEHKDFWLTGRELAKRLELVRHEDVKVEQFNN